MRHRKTLTRTKLGPNGYGRGIGEVIVVGLVARGLRAPASIPAWGGLAVCKPSRAGGRIVWGQESTGPELNWYQTDSTAPIAPAFDSVGPRLVDPHSIYCKDRLGLAGLAHGSTPVGDLKSWAWESWV
jgi:hypothetical protein